jgi:hypothetical protein
MKPLAITTHIVTDHTKHKDGMHFPIMDAIAHITYQLTKQGFEYTTEWVINSIDTNRQGQRYIELGWYVERKAVIVKLSGIETIYGENR